MTLLEIAVRTAFFVGWFCFWLMSAAASVAFVWWLAGHARRRSADMRELLRTFGGRR